MQRLLQGADRFRETVFREKSDLFRQLCTGQQPHTLFITCSDSRIVPNLVTNTDPGEIFVLRNAGNMVPVYGEAWGEAATIEYAIKVLKVRDVIVCGHTQCGAMAALLNPQSCASIPAVAEWIDTVRHVRERVEAKYGSPPPDNVLDLTIQENVLVQLEHLQTHPAVREALEARHIALHGCVYSLETGGFQAYDWRLAKFVDPAIWAEQQSDAAVV